MSSLTPPQNNNLKPAAADDDDYDDLDDVVQDFKPPSSSLLSPKPVSSGRPRTNTRVDGPPPGSSTNAPKLDGVTDDEDIMNSDFAKELAKGMEDLMKEISGAEGAGGDAKAGGAKSEMDDETAKALQAAWEAMLLEDKNGQTSGAAASAAGDAAGGDSEKKPASTDFQKTIRDGMERLRQSEQASGTPSGANGAGIPDAASMEALLASLGDGDNEGELAGFIDHMMNSILTKDILYEPLQEMAEKYPPFLENPPAPISDEDRERYVKQQATVKKIVDMFESPGYDEKNPETAKTIVDLMSEMQSHGSPPESLLGEPIPGLNFGEDGSMPEGCTIV